MQTVKFFVVLFVFFFQCDYSFDNVGTVSNFWIPHDEILRGHLEQPDFRRILSQCMHSMCEMKNKGTISEGPADGTRGFSIFLFYQKLKM